MSPSIDQPPQTPAEAVRAALRDHAQRKPRRLLSRGPRPHEDRVLVAELVALGDAAAEAEAAHLLGRVATMRDRLSDRTAELDGARAEIERLQREVVERSRIISSRNEEIDRLATELRDTLPPCPSCGCRSQDDADRRECGCDAGCNDSQHAPGVNVIVKAEREEIAALLKLAQADRDSLDAELYAAREQAGVAHARAAAEIDRLKATLAAATADLQRMTQEAAARHDEITALRAQVERLSPAPQLNT